MPNGNTGILFSQNNKIFLAYALTWHNFMRYLHYQVKTLHYGTTDIQIFTS